MGKCILMMEGKFMQWTSVSDSPVTPLLPEELFKKYWIDEYGRSGFVDYENLMETAKETGCSARGYTVNGVLKDNRAGHREKGMTKAEIIEAYTMTDPKEFEGWNAGRTKAFEDMAIEFGPVGRKAEAEKRKSKKGS
jgi:hypothetical protein